MSEPGRVIRRRNVKTRNRNGCVTCRARRLKCDETKPECNNCIRLSLPCGGYAPRIVFKDQTELLNQSAPRRTRSDQRSADSAAEVGQQDGADGVLDATREQSPINNYLTPDRTSAPDVGSDALEPQSPIYHANQPSNTINATVSLSESNTPLNWDSALIPDTGLDVSTPANEDHGLSSCIQSPSIAPGQNVHPLFALPGASDLSPTQTTQPRDNPSPTGTQVFNGIKTPPVIPHGLLESMKFPEDMLYYHHLRDPSPYGVLSVLYLNDVPNASYLNGAFYHAALALSALKLSKSDAEPQVQSQAAIHALEHFVTALGAVGKIQVDDDDVDPSTPGNIQDPGKRDKAVSWLATVLLLAYFELQRGQMRLWYVHSRAAVDFLSSHLSHVLATSIGESLIRAFSRIAALLNIYERTHSVQKQVTPSEVSNTLIQYLSTSTLPYDRLLYIMPRVNELEEDWRANLRPDSKWAERVDGLRNELEEWRNILPPEEVPAFDDEVSFDIEPTGGSEVDIKPFIIHSSYEPVRAATNFAHYLVSLLRLDLMYPPETGRKFTPTETASMIRQVCRLAIGLPHILCVRINCYGHGILPAMMHAYHMSDKTMANWIRKWISTLPNEREGIWDTERVQRLLAYLDEEYSRQSSRSGWTIIKSRMVDLEGDREDTQPDEEGGQSDRFCVEIYYKGKRGWGIDFVEIE
ncbi:hypothetical protein FSARC_2101 [Fusarium sarcochroum]|uniref:Zn(2)-C6 fungal-type domain-containing protein n=1 Tax=Fusarium sarcochroum TaxID=1208366 RepID=A0A8H4XDC3_9HYPO|nr:hypothetical protein FSARC_2101 [Fusarium sarcochroum]